MIMFVEWDQMVTHAVKLAWGFMQWLTVFARISSATAVRSVCRVCRQNPQPQGLPAGS